MDEDPEQLVRAFCKIVRQVLVPLTTAGVSRGSKVFGAAIVRRADLSVVQAATNDERRSPLLHGEINCLQTYFLRTSDAPTERTSPDDLLFFSTHEPCSLCLSAITWSGFKRHYFLFTYEDTRDAFGIPHDIDILREVFRVPCGHATGDEGELEGRALYNRENKFWKARSVRELVESVADETKRDELGRLVEETQAMYSELSETYQRGKGGAGIPLA